MAHERVEVHRGAGHSLGGAARAGRFGHSWMLLRLRRCPIVTLEATAAQVPQRGDPTSPRAPSRHPSNTSSAASAEQRARPSHTAATPGDGLWQQPEVHGSCDTRLGVAVATASAPATPEWAACERRPIDLHRRSMDLLAPSRRGLFPSSDARRCGSRRRRPGRSSPRWPWASSTGRSQ